MVILVTFNNDKKTIFIIYAVTKRVQVVMVMIIFKNTPVDDDFCLARIEKI